MTSRATNDGHCSTVTTEYPGTYHAHNTTHTLIYNSSRTIPTWWLQETMMPLNSVTEMVTQPITTQPDLVATSARLIGEPASDLIPSIYMLIRNLIKTVIILTMSIFNFQTWGHICRDTYFHATCAHISINSVHVKVGKKSLASLELQYIITCIKLCMHDCVMTFF